MEPGMAPFLFQSRPWLVLSKTDPPASAKISVLFLGHTASNELGPRCCETWPISFHDRPPSPVDQMLCILMSRPWFSHMYSVTVGSSPSDVILPKMETSDKEFTCFPECE